MKRFVYINDDSSQNLYCDNRISNRKYTILNFLPKNLWEQFRWQYSIIHQSSDEMDPYDDILLVNHLLAMLESQRKAEISSALKALWFNFSGRIPTETLAIKFTGKNYATWEFQFRMFLKGKELWGHIDGSLMAPENAKDLGQWETKDARIISWLLGSIEAHMVNNLRPFNTAKEMWDYLKRIYHQDNTARRFQLELEIGNLSQGDLSIEQYYSGFLNLWGEYSNIIYSKVPKEALASIQAIHEVSKRDQFLMKLRSDFDVARAGLLNRNPVPSLDICLGELLREEQRLATQAVLVVRSLGILLATAVRNSATIVSNMGTLSRITGTNQSVLTSEMVQQMILTAFSTLTLQGQGMNISSSWIVDSGASNHMTGSPDLLHNVRQYNGSQNIQIANGSNLPITAIGDIYLSWVVYKSNFCWIRCRVRRFMNQYFLLIACLQLWSLITPVNPASTWGPLIIIFAVSATKEAWDDYNRYLSDKQANEKEVWVVKDGIRKHIKAQDIHVGNIVWLRENDEVPCDLVLIGASEPQGICYVETAALDGETDLKTRVLPSSCIGLTPEQLHKIKGVIECPNPDKDIRRFDSNMRLFPPFIDNDLCPLTIDNTLLQSCYLRNTEWACGVAVYTG
ncbi:hypothetical protein ZIOFF_031429 [Zingiber officinale]|uniref:Uncharacterized protein n=1 Tax=Zingiber officinale TaxID=94328 RepID=A0A8J5GD53_ZINOF|nr:hypothetical protein ZIOFF_031429 [Zingiber officinale]